jgi:hypothetical protein
MVTGVTRGNRRARGALMGYHPEMMHLEHGKRGEAL